MITYTNVWVIHVRNTVARLFETSHIQHHFQRGECFP